MLYVRLALRLSPPSFPFHSPGTCCEPGLPFFIGTPLVCSSPIPVDGIVPSLLRRQRPVHEILGGGLVADVMLWRRSNVTICILLGSCSSQQLSNYRSLEGVLYCKPHFEQLFKETGSYNKSFQSRPKSSEKSTLNAPKMLRSPSEVEEPTPEVRSEATRSPSKPGKLTPELKKSFSKAEKLTPGLIRSPSKAAGMFSGTQEKCATCAKTAYPLEKVTVEGQVYHKKCFKCFHGGCFLSPSNYAALEGILYCKPHFSQLFKEKGSYNHLIKCASVKRMSFPAPDL